MTPVPSTNKEPWWQSPATRVVLIVLTVICFVTLGTLWRRAAQIEPQAASAQQQVEALTQRFDELERTLGEHRDNLHQVQQRASSAESAARESESSLMLAKQARETASEEADEAAREAEQARVAAEQLSQEAAAERHKRQEELQDMRQALNQILSTSPAPYGMDIHIDDGDALCNPGEATLHPKGRELLSRLSGVLLVSHGYRLHFRFPDGQPSLKRRARAIADYLEKAGIPKDSLIFGRVAKGPAAPGNKNSIEIQVVDTILPATQGQNAASERVKPGDRTHAG